MGIYEHGLGNWEAIRDSDPQGLGKKILPVNRSMKPQSSHLQTRAEYLLKLLQDEAKRKLAKKSRQSPRKTAAASSKGRRGRGRGAVASEEISKYFKKQPTRQSQLLVNISRDVVSINSDPESIASSPKSGRGQKRGAPASKRPASKRLRSSPAHKSTLASKLSSRTDRTPTPVSRRSPRKGGKERVAQGKGKQALSREEIELSALEGISDDQRVSDIGEGEMEMDDETFEKVYTHTYTRAHTFTRTHMHTHTHAHTHTHTYTHTHIHTHTHTHTHICSVSRS